jgi:hypothetical protein
MSRTLIQILAMLVLVGIALISTGKNTYAAGHGSEAFHDARSVVDASTTLATHNHTDHDEHGGAPCPHGGCSLCCAAYVATMALNCPETTLIKPAKIGPVLAFVHILPDVRLSVLPYRPPCFIA